MREEELESLRAHLIARQEQLLEEGDLRAEPNRADALTVPDEDTQPLNEMNQMIASKRNRARAQEAEAIRAALRRLDSEPDEFGECQDCGEDISMGRLRARPWARRCVECETLRSPRTKHRRRHAGDFMKDS